MKHNSILLWKKGVSLLFAFLLSLVLPGITLLAAVWLACFDRDIFYRNMAEVGYYAGVTNEILDLAEDYTLPTGMDLTVLDGILDGEIVSRDVNGYISAAFSGTVYTPDLESFAGTLTDNVHQFFEREGMEESDDREEQVREYVESIEAIYLETVKMPLLDYLMQAKNLYGKLLAPGFGILGFLAVLLVILILRMHHYLHRGLRYVAYAFGGASLMAGILPAAAYLSGFYYRIHLEPEYFYRFAMQYVDTLLEFCLYMSGLWLAAMISCLALIWTLKRRLKAQQKYTV